MFAATHIITGAIIGAATQNPAGAIIGGMASHYILDAVPHWEYTIERLQEERTLSLRTLPDFIKIGFDICIGFGVVLLFAWQTQFLWHALIGSFFGILPDMLWGFTLLFPNSFFRRLNSFHKHIHSKTKLPSPLPSLAASLAATAIFFLLVIRV